MSDTSKNAPEAGRKKVFIQTWGCQMNVYDSTRIGDALENDGYTAAASVDDADLVLLNTCHIRERAADKVYSHLGRLRQAKDRRAGGERPLTIGVTGCVAQAEGAEIVARERAVDLVAGPQTYHRIADIVADARTGNRPVETAYEIDDKFDHLAPATKRQVAARGVTAFLTVQEGCDKFCTFCVVPYTRGAEVSRDRAAIVAEAQDMAAAGVREITLLGQNVNAWHGTSARGAQVGLGELLHELAEISGIARLRYVTSHPRDMKGPRGDALIAAHRDLPQLMPYLHLPVQSGSDRILKAMNRRHTAAEYVSLIGRVREARPDLAVSGDFIVGFPGESDADFEATLQIVRATNYAQAYSFKYSTRPGTPAAELGDQVPEPVKAERLQALQALLNEQQHAFNAGLVGSTMEVLLEKPGKAEGQMIARSPWLQSVVIDPSATGARAGNAGDMLTVTIVAAHANSLAGTPVPRKKDNA